MLKKRLKKTGKHKKGSRRKAALIMSLFILILLLTACSSDEVRAGIDNTVDKIYNFTDSIVEAVEDIIAGFSGKTSDEETDESTESTEALSFEDWLREHPDASSEDYRTEDSSEDSSVSSDSASTEVEDSDEYGGNLHYCYTTLSSSEKKVYREVYDCLNTMSENVKLSTTDTDVLDKCFNYCIMDHPEIFYTDGYRATVTSMGETKVGLAVTGRYTMSAQKRKDYQERIDKAVDKILKDAPKDDTDYEKVKYCFEYIVSNTTYNVNAANNQNIISVFINGESVCQGYSLAMKYLLDRLGVQSAVVYGSANDSNHSWNIVKIDGTWCYVDSTWGDSSYRNYMNTEIVDEINYNYFGCNNEILRATHKIDSPLYLPNCTSLSAYYYVKEGLYFKSADLERLKAVFKLQTARNEDFFMIRADTDSVYKEFVKELFDNKKIFEIYKGSKRITYANDDTEKTISFWIE
ncbi:transglutaminase domain-containing protein [Lachnospiraceae bacterium C1.1]|nr:transglutaminase domain-containing protein [Lachnospiraceae bacterium C1.1]